MSDDKDLKEVVVAGKGKSRRLKENLVKANCEFLSEDQITPKNQREKYLVKNAVSLDLTGLQKSDSEGTLRQIYSPDTLEAYEKTLKEWRQKGAKMAYIYDYITDIYRKKLDRASIVALLLTSVITLLALSNLGLTEDDYPTLAIALKGANAVLATAAAICTAIPRILNWENTKDTCQGYMVKVDNLISSVMSEQSLPLRFRTDPEQYILENKEKYEMILNTAPHISHDNYENALVLYEQAKSRFRNNLGNV